MYEKAAEQMKKLVMDIRLLASNVQKDNSQNQKI